MSKLSGVKVEEYGFGWPPRLVSRVFRGTRYSINLFLAGGFVKIFGKDLNEKGSLESANSFQKKNYLSKMSIMLGGVGFNVILAFAIFYFLFLVGMPSAKNYSADKVYIQSINRNSPAETAGLKIGDQVVKINDQEVSQSESLSGIVSHFNGQKVTIMVYRNEGTVELEAVPDPYLGIVVSGAPLQKGDFVSSIKLAFQETLDVTTDVFKAFYGLLTRETKVADVSGPVGIAQISAETARAGGKFFWHFVAVLSLNLAVLNLIPFPAFDGGWVAVTTIEKISRRRFNQKYLEVANALGFAVIIIFLILITFKDILA